jgi:hypothetical protein
MALTQSDVNTVRRLLMSGTPKKALCSLLGIDERTLKKYIARYKITEAIPSLPRAKPTRALTQHAKAVLDTTRISDSIYDNLRVLQQVEPAQTSVFLRAIAEDSEHATRKDT